MFTYQGKRYENAVHEPIISLELFKAVQQKLQEKFVSKARTHNFLYTGLIKCSHCGCAVTAELHKGKYVYYHCTGRKGGECKKKFIREEKIEAAFVRFLELLKMTEEEVASVKEGLKELLAAKAQFTENSAECLEKEIKRLRNRLNN